MGFYNILVVEDDEIDLMNIKRAFDKARVVNQFQYAKDGIDALEVLDSGIINKPLVILLDIKMPRMNGIEFLKVLREKPDWADTPVVVLTTSNLDSDKVEAYKLKVAGYIIKPMQFSNFVDVISSINSYWLLSEFPPEISR